MNSLKVVGFWSLSIPLAVIITRYYLSSEPKHNKLKKKPQQEEEETEIKSIWSELKKKPQEEEEEEEEEEEVTEIKSIWSELDSNLLGEIHGRLCLTDQARFRAVCKNWFAAPSIIINSSLLLPWWVKLHPKTHAFEVYDPLSSFPKRLASVQNLSLTELGFPCWSSCSKITASTQQDWLFITVLVESGLFSLTHRYCFLLFSPLTKKFITLPQFHQSRRFSFRPTFSSSTQSDSFHFISMFSTQPDSPDCVFFLLDTKNASRNFALLTYRNGDKEWTARQFKPVPDFVPAICHPVYLGGILYIVSPFGQLASFNFLNEEFKFDSLILDDLFLQNVYSGCSCKRFTLNGELMLMFIPPIQKTNVNLPAGKPCIRKYDWSSKVWIPVSTLGDYALFVGKKIVGVSKFCTKDRTNNGILSNKIYRVFYRGCLIYSIQDGDLVEYKSVRSNLFKDGGGGDLPEYKYTRVCGTAFLDQSSTTFWLEPPSVRSSSNNQEVHGFRE